VNCYYLISHFGSNGGTDMGPVFAVSMAPQLKF